MFSFLLLAITSASHAGEADLQLTSLAQLEWQNRIILVYSTGAGQRLAAQLRDREDEVIDRRIAWFVVEGDQVISNFPGQLGQGFVQQLRSRYPAPSQSAQLIGLDGEVKAQAAEMDLDDLFGRIDQMPIRQWEMRQ